MPFSILYAYAFDGPNLYRPTPGVALAILSYVDKQQEISAQLKQYAMRVGIVLGQLAISSTAHAQGSVTAIDFASPTPQTALEVACLAVETSFKNVEKNNSPSDIERRGFAAPLDITMEHSIFSESPGDSEKNEELEERLWQLQQRRRAEALPLWALQRLAEARTRKLPGYGWKHGLQLGYGVRGVWLPVDTSSEGLISQETIAIRGQGAGSRGQEKQVDWTGIGTIPLIAISGGNAPQRHEIAQKLVSVSAKTSARYSVMLEGSFEEIRALLADSRTEAAIISLDSKMLLTQGLPFEYCSACVILAPEEMPAHMYVSSEDCLRAIALPLLVTDAAGIAIFELEEWQASMLQEYAACRVAKHLDAEGIDLLVCQSSVSKAISS